MKRNRHTEEQIISILKSYGDFCVREKVGRVAYPVD